MPRYAAVETRTEHGTAVHLTDGERSAQAVVYPSLGNNCVAFGTTPDVGGETVDVLLPPDNIGELSTVPFHGGLPILFPFPNRVRGGVFTFQGVTYHMDRLLARGWDRGAGQAIHGLVADRAWSVDAMSTDQEGAFVRCSLKLDMFPEIMEQYTFPCTISVTYRMREGELHMYTVVANTGHRDMPMGFGIHPWFPAALAPGQRLPRAIAEIGPAQRARAEVRVPANAIWELEHLMPTGTVLPVDTAPEEFDLREYRPLNGLFFDSVFTNVVRNGDGWTEAAIRDPETGLQAYIAGDRVFREWVLYAPKDRSVVALEPYTCTTDAVNLEPRGIDAGLIILKPGRQWNGEVKIGLRAG